MDYLKVLEKRVLRGGRQTGFGVSPISLFSLGEGWRKGLLHYPVVEVKGMEKNVGMDAGTVGATLAVAQNSTPARILVVEDDVDIRQVLCVYLQHSGFEVLGVSNGLEAIRIIPEYRPDLLVLDLMMRPVNGWEVLHWLRAQLFSPPLPVLVLTARNQLSEQVHGFEEGAVEYLTKPTQPRMIVERIRTILKLSVEQRAMLQSKRIDEQRKTLERISSLPTDEFLY